MLAQTIYNIWNYHQFVFLSTTKSPRLPQTGKDNMQRSWPATVMK